MCVRDNENPPVLAKRMLSSLVLCEGRNLGTHDTEPHRFLQYVDPETIEHLKCSAGSIISAEWWDAVTKLRDLRIYDDSLRVMRQVIQRSKPLGLEVFSVRNSPSHPDEEKCLLEREGATLRVFRIGASHAIPSCLHLAANVEHLTLDIRFTSTIAIKIPDKVTTLKLTFANSISFRDAHISHALQRLHLVSPWISVEIPGAVERFLGTLFLNNARLLSVSMTRNDTKTSIYKDDPENSEWLRRKHKDTTLLVFNATHNTVRIHGDSKTVAEIANVPGLFISV